MRTKADQLREMMKQGEPQRLLIQGESSQPQTKADQLKEENYQLQAQLKTTKSETMSALIQKRFTNVMTWMDK